LKADAQDAETILLGNEFHISTTRLEKITTQGRNNANNVKTTKKEKKV